MWSDQQREALLLLADVFVGQEQLRENLRIAITAARSRGEPLDHVVELPHEQERITRAALAVLVAIYRAEGTHDADLAAVAFFHHHIRYGDQRQATVVRSYRYTDVGQLSHEVIQFSDVAEELQRGAYVEATVRINYPALDIREADAIHVRTQQVFFDNLRSRQADARSFYAAAHVRHEDQVEVLLRQPAQGVLAVGRLLGRETVLELERQVVAGMTP